MKFAPFFRFFALVVALSTLGFSIQAQVFVPQNMFSNPVLQRAMENRNMTTTAISGLLRNQMLRNSAKGAKGKSAASAPVNPTKFTASSANSIITTLSTQSGGNQDEQKQAEAIFSKCLEIYWNTAKKDGFPSNDLAYAFEFFVVNNFHIYHDVFSNEAATKSGYYDESVDPTYVVMSEEKAVYRQFQIVLTGSPQIKKLTDKEKQQFAEMLVIMTNLSYQIYEAGFKSKDRKLIEQAREFSKANLENLFETIAENIVINSEGISLKGR